MIKPIILNSGREIGPEQPSYIIAEIGSNHDCSLEKAKKLITLAKQSGADAAKFQSFQAHTLVNLKKKGNLKWVKEPAYELLENLSLPVEWHIELQKHAQKEDIDFLSTPFDLERLALLIDLNVPLIKIASGDLTNKQLLIAAAKAKKPIVISTGAAFIDEIEDAVSTLKQAKAKSFAILQCVSCYPTEYSQANILAMQTLKKMFKVPVGYSDHTSGIIVALGAVALGASIIEKHFTDDNTLKGPDHGHSLNPNEFSTMVENIRELESALGSAIKQPDVKELDERVMARRALYANIDLNPGDRITLDMIKIVRHAYEEGIPAKDFDIVIGNKVKMAIPEHSLLRWDCFE